MSATKTLPLPSTATPWGLAEAAAQGVDGGVTARRQDLLHRTVAGIGDEDVAAAIHRHASGLVEAAAQGVDGGVTARRQDLLHRIVITIGDEDVAAAVHRHAKGLAEAAAQSALRSGAEGHLRTGAGAVDIGGCDHRSRAVGQRHRTIADAAELRRETHIEGTGGSWVIKCRSRRAGAAAGVGKVQSGRSPGQYGWCADGAHSIERKGEGDRDRGAGADGRRAEVHTLGHDLLHRTVTASATKTLPLPSTATPAGWLKPLPRVLTVV